jgi:hypothetical protein
MIWYDEYIILRKMKKIDIIYVNILSLSKI